MGKDTVSNQERAIATKASGHFARTNGAVDTCLHVQSKEPADFENHIPTDPFLEESTNSQNTTINNAPIWLHEGCVGEIGGTDSGPLHPDYPINSDGSTPYQKEAKSVGCSTNVFVEGKGVVRSNDETKQNAENSDGFVDGSLLGDEREITEQYLKDLCTIVEFTGEIPEAPPPLDSFATATPAVPLGKRFEGAAKDDYLEIYDGDTVNFTCARKDATVILRGNYGPSEDCKLNPGKHARWTISRTGGKEPYEEEQLQADEYELGSGVTKVYADHFGESSTSINLLEDKTPEYGPGAEDATRKKASTTNKLSWEEFLAFMRFLHDPAIVQVTAEACAGPETATLPIKPKGAVSYEVSLTRSSSKSTSSNGPGDRFKQRVEAIKRASELVQQVTELTPIGGVTWELKLFESFFFKIEAAYQRCKRAGESTLTTPPQKFTEAYLRLDRRISVGASPLIAFTAGITVSVFDLLALMFPALVPVANLVRRVLRGGILELTFSAGVSFGFRFHVGIDQHDEVTGGLERTLIPFTMSIRLALTIPRGELSATGKLLVDTKLVLGTPEQPGKHMKVSYEGEFAFELELAVEIDLFLIDIADSRKWKATIRKPNPVEGHV